MGILGIYAMLRKLQLRWSGHHVRMDEKRLPKRLLYGDVATGSHRQGGQIRRCKDALNSSLKRLQINPSNLEDLAHERPTWRRTVKTGAAICEVNRIAAAKAKREARKSQPRPPRNTGAQPPPTCPRCQQTFRARIGLNRHLLINCSTRTASAVVHLSNSSSSSTPLIKSDRPPEQPLPSSSSSSSTATKSAVEASVMQINTTHNPDISTTTNTTIVDIRGEDLDYTCPICGRTFTSHMGLVAPCESIAQRLANQCLEHQPTSAAPASTVHIALAHSCIVWSSSTTCVFTRAELTEVPTYPAHTAHDHA
ncbi:hypothetical protein SprV_0401662300 [Sparganum proliferum]